jgi:hypothetical protein
MIVVIVVFLPLGCQDFRLNAVFANPTESELAANKQKTDD